MEAANTSESVVVHKRLLDAEAGEGFSVYAPYAELVRLACVVMYHEQALGADDVDIAFEWWIKLGRMLIGREGWNFSVRDLEPMWIKNLGKIDYQAVHVEFTKAGLAYGLTTSTAAVSETRVFRSVADLAVAL